MNIKRKLISSATIVIVGVDLVGCSGPEKKVSDGTVYSHKYSDLEESYCLATTNRNKSTRISGKTGSITIVSSGTKATVKNLCYGSYLYTDGEAKITEITDTTITLKLGLRAVDRTLASSVIAPLPKNDKYISVPIDLEQEVYVHFNKNTK